MKVLLINPPYQTITSNFGVGHQVPLGLLMVGGPLIDAGHEVRLLDAECNRLSMGSIVRTVRAFAPDMVCTYCGQHGFWVSWRYRDPIKLVDEIELLYRRHDVRFLTLADENPTTRQDVWQRFLEELARRRLPVE